MLIEYVRVVDCSVMISPRGSSKHVQKLNSIL